MNYLLDWAMKLVSDGQTINDLQNCYRNYDRLCLINRDLLLRRQKEVFLIPNEPKSNQQSEKCRLIGNKLFYLNNWFGALEYYNKSICFATKNSVELAIGYANRSSVYLELKEYTLCLENISLAKKAGLPERLMNKLNKREADCIGFVENGEGNPNIYRLGKEEPKLSRKAHPRVPFIADCLKMERNSTYGRNIVTVNDLVPGEIVAIEDAFVSGIYEDFNYRRCTYCTNENMMNLMPCDVCTNTMFCSKCANEAEEDFHKFECPISYFLTEFEKTRFVLRLVIRALKSFTSFDDMIAFMKESPEHTVFSFDQTETLSAKQKYLQVHSLITNDEKQTGGDILFRSIYSFILYDNLLSRTTVSEMLPLDTSESARVALADIVYHCFQIVPQNGHILNSSDGNGSQNIGGAIYPFASLLNHSCSPNVFRISCGTKVVFVVLRNIKKGEQLLDCYTKDYSSKTETRQERRKNIKEAVHFDCRCIACVYNFPLRSNYKMAKIPTVPFDEDVKQRIANCSTYLKKYDNKYPCVEVDSAQEMLIGSMNQLYGNVSAKCNLNTTP